MEVKFKKNIALCVFETKIHIILFSFCYGLLTTDFWNGFKSYLTAVSHMKAHYVFSIVGSLHTYGKRV